ncbi:hypothetical protein JOF56_005673 [Kibdelosporangium banguiense]|uniref:DUF6545 domain-containing protein n=1 Tax=Kibdelosporangium banguiense TaxID=1365924 RepID=A0ABS4TLJ5_9PSEU|nr:MAB_1171c family putative transporter [Kibdelosporangium banguiense]MBP2325288.1 hypothetical protein [Kibdelosporangium banguiense]
MTVLLVAYGFGSLAVLLWMFTRLARRPGNLPLWALTGLVACWAIAFPLGLAADREATVLGVAPMVSRLLQHGVLLVGVNCLIAFFLFSALEAEVARRRVLRFGVPLVVALAILTVAVVLTPEGVRTKDHTVTSVATFWVTADLYMAFGFAATAIWALRYAREAERRLARGLRIASAGLFGIVLADCLFVPAIIIRWAGGDAAPPALSANGAAETTLGWYGAMFFLLPGIVLCLIGISYPAAMIRLGALRVWWRHLRAHHRLAPLWTELNSHFPEDRLSRVPVGRWRDTLSLRGVHRRYYRRVIECRDGLVRISPYIDQQQGDDLAAKLKEALRAHACGQAATQDAVPLAVPDRDGLDADVEQLITLAYALRRAKPQPAL